MYHLRKFIIIFSALSLTINALPVAPSFNLGPSHKWVNGFTGDEGDEIWGEKALTEYIETKQSKIQEPLLEPDTNLELGEKCIPGSFAPNPHDCGFFFICVHQKYTTEKCPTGLHFDSKINTCNYPPQANCKE